MDRAAPGTPGLAAGRIDGGSIWNVAFSRNCSQPCLCLASPRAPAPHRQLDEGHRGSAEKLESIARRQCRGGGIGRRRRSCARIRSGKNCLSPAAYDVLREEGTEYAGSSPLNAEKRPGVFVCAGCALPLFTSAMKYESGTGWPSFFTTIPGVFGTNTDHKIFIRAPNITARAAAATTATFSTTARRRPVSATATTASRCASSQRPGKPDRDSGVTTVFLSCAAPDNLCFHAATRISGLRFPRMQFRLH